MRSLLWVVTCVLVNQPHAQEAARTPDAAAVERHMSAARTRAGAHWSAAVEFPVRGGTRYRRTGSEPGDRANPAL